MRGHPVGEYSANLGGKASAPALIHQADFACERKGVGYSLVDR